MGYYINKIDEQELPSLGKAAALKKNGAVKVEAEYQPNLICVVNNGAFQAAAYVYSEREFEAFNHPDGRAKVWLTHPKAAEWAGYKE